MTGITFGLIISVVTAVVISIEAAPMKKNNLFQTVKMSNRRVEAKNCGEARIYFDQLPEVPGVMPPMFPIEINVPDSITGMVNAMMVMWSAMQEYFGGGQDMVESRIVDELEWFL